MFIHVGIILWTVKLYSFPFHLQSAALAAKTPLDPVVEIQLLFQITNADMPDCKSVGPSGELPLASEQMSQPLASLPGCSGCPESTVPCHNTTMPI